MTGRQITEMICDHFKISYTDGTVLDLSDHLRIELKNDSVQSFDTKWDETIIPMNKQPDDESGRICVSGKSIMRRRSSRCLH